MAALNEFDLIKTYFTQPAPDGYLGVGDDCALFTVQPGHQLAVSTDTLIQGQHFFADVDPYTLGHKTLAVNLSDLTAMGARPIGCVLALAVPHVDQQWLQAFSAGFYQLANAAACPLIGGDTTRHPDRTVLTVTVFGEVPAAKALRRSAARPDDDLWLTGSLGAPDLALSYLLAHKPIDHNRLAQSRVLLEQPLPPYLFAPSLLGHAHAAIDISDGLLQDVGHLLTASGCGAMIQWSALPIHPALAGLSLAEQQQHVLTGGDVFQLCFSAPAHERAYLQQQAQQHGIALHRIGQLTAAPELVVYDAQGQPLPLPQQRGFDHFQHHDN